MGFCLLTGGFDMINELLDLLQLVSYLKYMNVIYPYNVDLYFNYMSQFNFNSLTNNIPYINDLGNTIG